MIRSLAPAAAVCALLVAGGCGDDGSAGCTELREALDPASTLHVVDPDRTTFLTDPPTSGPHVAGPALAGPVDEPLSPAAQVRVLEAGGAVVQYRAPVTAAELSSLLDVDARVVVAPGADLSAPVVATAWTWKLTCGSVDLDALHTFVERRPADAPGLD